MFSPVSCEKLRICREMITFSRVPPPEFRFKISSWLYPKIYIHIYGRCIRKRYVLTAYDLRGDSAPLTKTGLTIISPAHSRPPSRVAPLLKTLPALFPPSDIPRWSHEGGKFISDIGHDHRGSTGRWCASGPKDLDEWLLNSHPTRFRKRYGRFFFPDRCHRS